MLPPLEVVRVTVSQDEIDSLIGIENQLKHLRKIRNRRAHDMLDRLLAGAKVEQGIHCAEVRQEIKGARRETRLVVR